MPSTTRTFIAVSVPEALAARLRRLQQQLSGELPGVRLSVIPPFHVTLAFLGDVDHVDLADVCRAAAAEAANFGKFELKLEGLGVFPNAARPRVLWAGVTGPGLDTLCALQSALAGAAARLKYPTDGKPFHPHVTLGRFLPRRGADPSGERALTQALNRYKTWHAGPFPVTEAVTFASTQTPDGAAYAPLGRAPLAARKPGAPP